MKQRINKRINEMEDIILRKEKMPDIQKTMTELAKVIRKGDLLNPDDPDYPSNEEFNNLFKKLDEFKRLSRT